MHTHTHMYERGGERSMHKSLSLSIYIYICLDIVNPVTFGLLAVFFMSF